VSAEAATRREVAMQQLAALNLRISEQERLIRAFRSGMRSAGLEPPPLADGDERLDKPFPKSMLPLGRGITTAQGWIDAQRASQVVPHASTPSGGRPAQRGTGAAALAEEAQTLEGEIASLRLQIEAAGAGREWEQIPERTRDAIYEYEREMR